MPNLYIIAGCNGAGKTTASMTVLPEILNCYEFVNADEIARGLSPFQPQKVAIEAGRIMLDRINHLVETGQDFVFTFTKTMNNLIPLVKKAEDKGYSVIFVFVNRKLIKPQIEKSVSHYEYDMPSEVRNFGLKDKILWGFQKAVNKVYNEARKNGQELVVADKDGNVIKIKP
jgi:predicted ABC-type ATPase